MNGKTEVREKDTLSVLAKANLPLQTLHFLSLELEAKSPRKSLLLPDLAQLSRLLLVAW